MYDQCKSGSLTSWNRKEEREEDSVGMSDSRVETISRLAQWRIENFGPCSYKKSDAFKVGLWNWHLSVEKNRYMYIRLFPEPSRISKEQPPIARFILRVSNTGSARKLYISPVHERLLRTCEDFVWPVDSTYAGRFIIDVEFLDLKVCAVNGGEARSIWPMEVTISGKSTQRCLSRMLEESIHSDVTIHTKGGTELRAHRAVLSASSAVFHSMFTHALAEKETSSVRIEDMSAESCAALLGYLYGTIRQEEFWEHRVALLGAADKYDICELKEACEDSLSEDINSSNVLRRLQEAWLYRLPSLKKGCLVYLFEFGKIYDIRDEINHFVTLADRDLLAEMFQEVLTVWKPV